MLSNESNNRFQDVIEIGDIVFNHIRDLNVCLPRVCDLGLQGFPPGVDLLVDLFSSSCVVLLKLLCLGR